MLILGLLLIIAAALVTVGAIYDAGETATVEILGQTITTTAAGVFIAGLATMLLFLLGVWACARTERELGVHDHPGIVWDEVVGVMIALLAAPAGWVGLIAGFALFRLFDVWKPWPIRLADRRVHGGLGIMLDDALAGAAAAAILWAAQAAGLPHG